MGTPVSQGNPKTLGGTHHDIGTHLTWRGEKGQAHEVGGHDDTGSGVMGLGDEAGVIDDLTIRGRILDQGSEDIVGELEALVITYHHLDAHGHTLEVVERAARLEADPGEAAGDRSAPESVLASLAGLQPGRADR